MSVIPFVLFWPFYLVWLASFSFAKDLDRWIPTTIQILPTPAVQMLPSDKKFVNSPIDNWPIYWDLPVSDLDPSPQLQGVSLALHLSVCTYLITVLSTCYHINYRKYLFFWIPLKKTKKLCNYQCNYHHLICIIYANKH